MTSFHQIKLGDFATVISGFAFKSEDFSDHGVPVIKIGNISIGHIEFENSNTQYIPFFLAKNLHKKFHVQRDDILISLTGSHMSQPNSVVGRVAKYHHGHLSLLNQRAGKVNNVNCNVIDKIFLYYLLSTKEIRQEIALLAHGAANQANVSPKDIEKLQLNIPSVAVQNKIAGILSAYDDLIENNKRRIALLEKMAEELYREWFVRFRFPGWQQAEFEKGIPKGWEVTSIADLGSYLNGYAFKPEDWFDEGIAIIKIKEMTSGVSQDTPRNSGDNIPKKYHFYDGEIIFSWSATLLVKIWGDGNGLLNQHLFKVTPNNGIPKEFLFFAIKFSLPIFDSLTTGSTMKHIKRKELDMVKVPCPDSVTLKKFEHIICPILNEVLFLSKQNKNLVKTKEALLPRLMSGKLAVEDLAVQLPPSMQY